MKNLVRTLTIFVLATSMSAFAASKKADESPTAPEVNNAVTEAKSAPCASDQENQAKTCITCQVQSEDSKEKSDRQKLIEEQEKEWLKNVDYAR